MNVILFEEDWGRYPSASVHYETRNRSWVELAKKLELAGVKNNKFFLALLNPSLRFVDPWDEELPLETQTAILTEIKLNPWYFFREIARFDKTEFNGKRYYFNANRGNIAALWCYFNHQDYNLTQPRQTGKSTSSNWLLVWLMFFAYKNTDIFLLTKDDKLRQSNVRAIKTYRDLLPNYLNPSTKADVNNLIAVSCVKHGNRLYTAVSQNSPADADKIGRGFSCKTYVIDEGPYVDYLEISLNAMLPGGDAKQLEAKERFEPYGNIFTTTSGSKSDPSGAHYYNMVTNCLQWSEKLYDVKNWDMLDVLVDKASVSKKLINIVFNHRQLGFTDEWLIGVLRKNNASGAKANKDYFNIWDDGSTESPLDKDLAKLIRAAKREPDWMEFTKENYIINWYIPKREVGYRMTSGRFVLGVDTSDAVGKDAIACTLVDCDSLEIVATMVVKETNLIHFGYWLVDFLVKYKSVTLIPERKSSAPTLIDLLLIRLPIAGEDPFKRIFNRVVHEWKFDDAIYKQFHNRIHRNLEAYTDVKDQFGYSTSGGQGDYSRYALYSNTLILACEYGGLVLNDEQTIKEILGLQRKGNRIDHPVGGHDDRVMSWLFCAWLLIHSKNISYYGIVNPLSKAVDYRSKLKMDAGDEVLANRIQEGQRQSKIKEEIENYLLLLKNVKDEFLSNQHEAKLRKLESQYTGTDFGALTVSDLIRQAKSEKFKRRINRRHQVEGV